MALAVTDESALDDVGPEYISIQQPAAKEGYSILSKIGQGGMGTVWKAKQLGTGQIVALKSLKHELLNKPSAASLFHIEVLLAAKLRHPAIVRVFDSGLDRLEYFYVMELIEGCPIDTFVHAKHLKLTQVVDLVARVSDAIGYAHDNSVVHLDIKPTNVLISEDGLPHIVDFGLARAIEGSRELNSCQAYIGGTSGYAAPEQFGTNVSIGSRADVYALGRLLQMLITGADRDCDTYQYLDLLKIIEKATSNITSARYSDGGALARELRLWLDLRPISARSYTYTRRTLLWAKRNRILLRQCATVVATITLLVAVFSYAFYQREVVNQARLSRSGAESYRDTMRSAHERITSDELQLARHLLEETEPQHRQWEWKYLSQLTDQSVNTWKFSPSRIRDFNIGPTGDVFYILTSGRVGKVTSDKTDSVLNTPLEHTLSPVFISPSANYIIGIDGSGRYVFVNRETSLNTPPSILAETGALLLRVSDNGRYILLKNSDEMFIYDMAVNSVIYSQQAMSVWGPVTFDHEANRLIWYDTSFNVLDLHKLSVTEFNSEFERESPLSLTSLGGHLFVGYTGGYVMDYDLSSPTDRTIIVELPVEAGSLSSSNNAGMLSAGTSSGTIYLVDLRNNSYRPVYGHADPIVKTKFDLSGERLYSLDTNGILKKWETNWGIHEMNMWPSGHALVSAVSSDGMHIACANEGNDIYVLDSGCERSDGKLLDQFEFPSMTSAIAVDNRTHQIAVADNDSLVSILADRLSSESIRMALQPALWLDYSPHSTFIVASNTQEVLVWPKAGGDPVHWFDRRGPAKWLRTSNPQIVMIRHADGKYYLEVRDIQLKRQVYNNLLGSNPIIYLAVAGRSPIVATVDSKYEVTVIDVVSGEQKRMEGAGDLGAILSLALSPDGKRLITAGERIAVWSVEHGFVLDVIEDKIEGLVTTIQFTESGEEVIGLGLNRYYRWSTR